MSARATGRPGSTKQKRRATAEARVRELEAENATLRDALAHCRHKPRIAELEAEVVRLTGGHQPASPALPGDERTCCNARIGHYPGCPADQPPTA